MTEDHLRKLTVAMLKCSYYDEYIEQNIELYNNDDYLEADIDISPIISNELNCDENDLIDEARNIVWKLDDDGNLVKAFDTEDDLYALADELIKQFKK